MRRAPFVRFYAGVPMLDPNGLAMGSLCVVDVVPRQLAPECVESLIRLAEFTEAALEARRLAIRLLGLDASPAVVDDAHADLELALRPLLDAFAQPA